LLDKISPFAKVTGWDPDLLKGNSGMPEWLIFLLVIPQMINLGDIGIILTIT
jgi:hypothetical protein